MGGADEQRRNSGRRGWWLVGALAVSGAGIGAYAGSRLEPDVSELVPSLAAAGFGLGGLIGLLLLAPVGLWRAWSRRTRRRAAAPGPATVAGDTPAREDAKEPAAVDAPGPKPPTQEPEAGPATETPQTLASPVPPEAPEEDAQALEPEEPPPPAGEEPGWYADPGRDGVRRYWDGQAWTGHVWRGREERTRKARKRR